MVAIITADIVASRRHSGEWLEPLKEVLNRFGKSPENWEIFRGDSFQLELPDASDAFTAVLEIKAKLRMLKTDARIAIGIGETEKGKNITERTGPAFLRSGDLFETLKPQKKLLAISTGNSEVDNDLNLVLKMAATLMDDWLPQSAEFAHVALMQRDWSQEEIGKKLGIAQAAVSRRRKRAHFDILLEVDGYFRKTLNSLL